MAEDFFGFGIGGTSQSPDIKSWSPYYDEENEVCYADDYFPEQDQCLLPPDINPPFDPQQATLACERILTPKQLKEVVDKKTPYQVQEIWMQSPVKVLTPAKLKKIVDKNLPYTVLEAWVVPTPGATKEQAMEIFGITDPKLVHEVKDPKEARFRVRLRGLSKKQAMKVFNISDPELVHIVKDPKEVKYRVEIPSDQYLIPAPAPQPQMDPYPSAEVLAKRQLALEVAGLGSPEDLDKGNISFDQAMKALKK